MIQSHRRALGLTQEQLADKVHALGDQHIKQSDISRIERGLVGLPRQLRLERIARALDLSVGELLARSGWTGFDVNVGDRQRIHHEGADARGATVPRGGRRDVQGSTALSKAFGSAFENWERFERNREMFETIKRRFEESGTCSSSRSVSRADDTSDTTEGT
jgi:transcriptional regulator with XRE-family HTH domain